MPTHDQLALVHHGVAAEDARIVVYGVHGRTQSPQFFIDLAARLELEGVCWWLPAAADHSWYPGKFMEQLEANQPQLDQALGVIQDQLSQLLQARDAGGAPVVVFGFSQGACLLAEHLLVSQPGVDGALLHTGGYLGPRPRSFAPAPDPGLSGLAVELFCADEDPWVPLHRVKDTAAAFEGLAGVTTLSVYRDEEHHITEDAAARIREYLTRRARA
ncbi:PE-PPE domain-containing protein [Nesterenkonia sp. E16_7]|uniref:PE-PPE domain-containing protein n=1 Tax=unclassified Nesterenkonia TaxID=2629769 RepID=UPI001A937BEB|nr:PE-PPE domain-containing protein [Nesterenkonia sp. E16_10]MBO0597927.1 PE-PPE domain-containing protein [Nesterenkonia sp. E16_7]